MGTNKAQNELTFRGEVAGGLEILSGRVQRAARKYMGEDEPVLFCLREARPGPND
jgi:hypothetical protein